MKFTVNMVLRHTWLKKMYEAQSEENRKCISKRIEELLGETREYQSAVNLENLSCVLSGIAMCEVLGKERFLPSAEAYLVPVCEEKRKQMNRMASLPGSFGFLSRLVPSVMCMGNGSGWHTEKTARTESQFGFDTTRCIYNTLCRKYGVVEVGCLFCRTDEIVYGAMPGIRMVRTGTLCRGDEKCDFRFFRG